MEKSDRNSRKTTKRKTTTSEALETRENKAQRLASQDTKDYSRIHAPAANSNDGVAERMVSKLSVGKGKWRVGLVSTSTPFWFWAVSSLGDVVWIDVLEKDLIQEETGAMDWRSKALDLQERQTKNRGLKRRRIAYVSPADWETREPVDVIFFEKGIIPGPGHEVWLRHDVKLVFWIGGRKKGGPSSTVQGVWIQGIMKLDHTALGVVTDLESWIHVAERKGLDERRFVDCWADHLEQGLKHTTFRGVIDPTIQGKECPLSMFRDDTEDSLSKRGVSILERKLVWKKDLGRLHVLPSVYATRSGFVERKIAPSELAVALDFPAALHKKGSDQELDRWTSEIGVPFKSRVQVARSILGWTNEKDEVSRGQQRIENEEVAMGVAPTPVTRMTEDCNLFTALDSEGGGSLNMEERREDRNLKATKSDDAEIPTYLWDDRICSHFEMTSVADRFRCIEALNVIRRLALRYWKRRVCSDFWSWWRQQRFRDDNDERERTKRAGLSALNHALLASWWDWDHGSSPFFWRMPKLDWMVEMRDGLDPMWIGEPPAYRRRQRANPDPEARSFEKKKLTKVRHRGYIVKTADIKSLTSFFSVPKGDSDIRMVYDGTKSGLNDALFAPWFGLGNVTSMLRTVEPKTWSADNDFGEMFLNFWIHPDLRQYTGIDITELFPEELQEKFGSTRIWEAWCRCAMGLTTSPYQTTQCAQRVKRIIFGDKSDPDNIFGWTDVRINLPGDEHYDPSLPWISKVRANGDIAADVHPYVDDLRETAPSEEEAWLAASRMAKGASYFGLQDAARKRRPPSKAPGAWAGAVVESSNEGKVYKTVSQERWNKTRKLVGVLKDWADDGGLVDRKELERIRGFLVYVSFTFDVIVPYLKGIHLTLESWRDDRDVEGWRLKEKDRRAVVRKREREMHAPGKVKQAPRFKDDVYTLHRLTDSEHPPKILARPTSGASVAMIFADASGEGFGSSLWLYGEASVETEHGLWTREYGSRSSNFRELYNLVLRLEGLVKDKKLPMGTEVFMFTDNSTAESAFYKGTSRSRLLFKLVLRTKQLEMNGHIFVRVIWVAGTRMIEQGTDGLSRGDLMTGVMTGVNMLLYVPLNKSVVERQDNVIPWLESVGNTAYKWRTLTTHKWFDEAFEEGEFIWTPPPAIADVAVDLLCDARHIRTRTAHMFVYPALMTNRWRKKLGKVADFVFTIPVGTELWPKSHHEPLIVAFVCPFLYRTPWQVKRATGLLDEVEGELSSMWASGPTAVRDLLRKLWAFKGNE